MDDLPIYDDGPVYAVGINSAKYSFEQAYGGLGASSGQV